MSKTVQEVLNDIPKELDEDIKRFNTKSFLIYLGVGFLVGLVCFTGLFLLL